MKERKLNIWSDRCFCLFPDIEVLLFNPWMQKIASLHLKIILALNRILKFMIYVLHKNIITPFTESFKNQTGIERFLQVLLFRSLQKMSPTALLISLCFFWRTAPAWYLLTGWDESVSQLSPISWSCLSRKYCLTTSC